MSRYSLWSVYKISNELTYRRYLMNRGKVRDLFQKLSLREYVALYIMIPESENCQDADGKIYLKDLADKMELTVRRTSKMIEKLSDGGLVRWSYDGNGSRGTYVKISEKGKKRFQEQESILKQCYEKVMDKFGKDNLILLLQLMKQFDVLVSDEIKKMDRKRMDFS